MADWKSGVTEPALDAETCAELDEEDDDIAESDDSNSGDCTETRTLVLGVDEAKVCGLVCPTGGNGCDGIVGERGMERFHASSKTLIGSLARFPA